MANFFPKSANWLPVKILICLGALATTVALGMNYYFTPKYTRVGYKPDQPVPFSHALHVKQLGMDCRYCHSHVEESSHSNLPTSQTCMACHAQVKSTSPKLQVVRDSWKTGKGIEWVQVHRPPDYVYFNHAAHVNRGVSCAECHGKVNEMEVVYHAKSHSMDFCLECHRQPEKYLRPPEQVYNLDWQAPSAREQLEMGRKFVHDWNVNPPLSCQGCHR